MAGATRRGQDLSRVIRYLIDSSALWRILRDRQLRDAWAEVISAGAIGSCHPQRAEFRRSARNLAEYDDMNDMFATLYPDVRLPKNVWQWVESAQYRLVRSGVHRAASLTDLLICGSAAAASLVVLHDDNDYTTVARKLDDVVGRRVTDLPSAQ